jgi:GT2 family glycosyltransferase/exopolysaccharide biosynthesis predicted pyruvyltransferase EpsI
VTTASSLTAIETSRRLILKQLDDPPDLTFVRGVGNRGDDLIWAGTRQLLAEKAYREVDLDGLCATSGHTVLLSGGGAFCRSYHEVMPRALAVADLRFERVIVLPSSFDPSEDDVREALSHTRATIFARERESYERIASLCEAQLAHDCAFFFDFEPYRKPGHGVLNAFRTDRERTVGQVLPEDNEDISVTASSLEQWLETIADHELVRTDRAHVMIAAAMLGKRVEFAPGSYHKIAGIAQYALSDYPVTRLPSSSVSQRRRALDASPPTSTRTGSASARVTAIVLTQDHPEQALKAIDSLRQEAVSLRKIVIDNNSPPRAVEALVEGCAIRENVSIRHLDRNLGSAGGRRLGVEAADSELVLFIDDDAELAPGALDLLVADLDAHPDAAAITATVVFPDGRTQHSGGRMRLSEAVAEFELIGSGKPPEALPASGPVDWVPQTALLIRRDLLSQYPLNALMATYFEDNEWCYRVNLSRRGSFRRSREARAIHNTTPKNFPGVDFATRSRAVELLYAGALFYEWHGKLFDIGGGLFDLVPGMRDESGKPDLAAARLLMELLLAKGTDWAFMEWMNGDFDSLLANRRLGAQRAEIVEQERRLAELEQTVAGKDELLERLQRRHLTLTAIETGGWWRLHQRLLPVLRVYWRLRGRESAGGAGIQGP